MKDRKSIRRCSGSSYNFSFMTFDFYAAVIILAESFVQFLIGSLKLFLLRNLSLLFFNVVFVYNYRRLTIQMNQMKKNLTNWILVRVRWYVWYRIGWVVLCHRSAFRCHAFWWWVIRWWWRFTFPINKYSRRGYQRVRMKWMNRRGCMGCMYWRYISQCCSLINYTSLWVRQIPISWQ